MLFIYFLIRFRSRYAHFLKALQGFSQSDSLFSQNFDGLNENLIGSKESNRLDLEDEMIGNTF